MPTILFGAEPSPVRIGEGEFDCPECQERHRYHRTRVTRRLRLLGALLPGGTYGEYVECEGCLATFRPEVLAYDAGHRTPETRAEYQVALKRILALMVAADGVIRDPELKTVQGIFHAVTGRWLTRNEVIAEVHDAGRAPMTAARYLARVVGYLNSYGKEQILRGASLVSRCDGDLDRREAEVVRRLGGVMHVPEDVVVGILAGAEDGWKEPTGSMAST